MCQCSFGMTPCPLVVPPKVPMLICGLPVATIMDFVPLLNIASFGMCSSPSNPTVAAATAAALGVLTPMPCIPATTAPWISSNPKIMSPMGPCLEASDTCMCMWSGKISISNPGQFVVL
ncbi:MAG: DUF4280 domain-containing protein [Holosporales bacterium]|nr:DUF4280 domain-containing protein [Holosporales bacterium]